MANITLVGLLVEQ